VPPEQLAALQNPQLLLSKEATARAQQSLAALGPQGQALVQQLMDAMRSSLAGAITDIFLVGCACMVVGFVVTLFLPELPLRRSHGRARTQPGEGAAPAAMVAGLAPDVAQAGKRAAGIHDGGGRRPRPEGAVR
jgi:hypothetical protein